MGFWTGLLAKMFGNEAVGQMSEVRTQRKSKLARRKARQAAVVPKAKVKPPTKKEIDARPYARNLPRIKRSNSWQARLRLANSKRK